MAGGGSGNKEVLPASFSLGVIFLLLIDNISSASISIEIPVGILTAIKFWNPLWMLYGR